jgi:hypothetical protein
MSILARIRAAGGDVIRAEWRLSLRRGRLSPAAIAWIKPRWLSVCAEAWPQFDAWLERAAIREFDGGEPREVAERAAYQEIVGC